MHKINYVAELKAAAIILSDAMCAAVAYNWRTMEYGIKYEGYSAPAYTALWTAVPFLICVAVCLILAIVIKRKSSKNSK